jgi:DMSO/TMAO reductase YedYZ molybdopterin-dependent catalytic subunit
VFHCVTGWSKLHTVWQGVSVDTLLDGVETSAEYAMAFSEGGYTTNLSLEDLTDGKAWIVFNYDGAPLEKEHGGVRPQPLALQVWSTGAEVARNPGDG